MKTIFRVPTVNPFLLVQPLMVQNCETGRFKFSLILCTNCFEFIDISDVETDIYIVVYDVTSL